MLIQNELLISMNPFDFKSSLFCVIDNRYTNMRILSQFNNPNILNRILNGLIIKHNDRDQCQILKIIQLIDNFTKFLLRDNTRCSTWLSMLVISNWHLVVLRLFNNLPHFEFTLNKRSDRINLLQLPSILSTHSKALSARRIRHIRVATIVVSLISIALDIVRSHIADHPLQKPLQSIC